MTKIKKLIFTVVALIITYNIAIWGVDLIAELTKSPNKQAVMTPSVTQSPKIIAHRGANDRINEATIAAYKMAAADVVDALEIDLRMTEDGALIAMHDQTINRTTNGQGEVSDYSLEEIKSFMTIGQYRGQKFMEEIPTLNEILSIFTDTEHYYIETRLVNGELKMEEPLIELLEEYHLLEKGLVTIQSFSKQSLNKIHELNPQIPLTLLYKKGKFNLKDAVSSPYPFIGIESSDVTRNVVKKLHQSGKEVHVYFTNPKTQKKEQKRIKALNVDGYFTDYIEYTKKILQ